MKWKNEKRGERIISSNVEVGAFRLSVHHYIGNGDIWFMSCYGLFEKTYLGEIPLNDAQVMAATRLQLKLEEAIKVITGGDSLCK